MKEKLGIHRRKKVRDSTIDDNGMIVIREVRTMKKLFLILIAGFIIILLAGCNKSENTVTITTDRNLYTPAMSSARGITMTPNFTTQNKYTNLTYHWTTSKGEFIGLGKDVKNQGEAVIWSAIENDTVMDIKNSFDIKLEVIEDGNQKILASTELTVTPNNGFYEVNK